MTTFTFKPDASKSFYKWSDPASWVGGVVPNSATADVVFPVVKTSSGSPFFTDVSINQGEAFRANSVEIHNSLEVSGSLTVAGTATNAGTMTFNSGKLTAGSLVVAANDIVQGTGSISVGTFTNNGSVSGGFAISATRFTNLGTVTSGGDTPLSLTVTPGGFTGLSNGTLSSGAYVSFGSDLVINAGSVISTLATTITLQGGMVVSHDPATGQNIALDRSLDTIAPSGSLVLVSGAYSFSDPDIAGTLTMRGTTLAGSLDVDPGGRLQGFGTIAASVHNDGTIRAGDFLPDYGPSGQRLVIAAPVTGNGIVAVGAGVAGSIANPLQNSYYETLEIKGALAQNVIFENEVGQLQIDDPSRFTGAIGIKGAGDRIVLQGISKAAITGVKYIGDTTHGTLTLSHDGISTVINVLGNFKAASFTLSVGPQALSTDPASILITATPVVRAVPSDFNGDGHSDVLWYNAGTRGLTEWQFTGDGSRPTTNIFSGGSPGPGWQVAETFDWNGDSKADILWRNADTGAITIWRAADGVGLVSNAYNDAGPGKAWSIAATGDFDGDGKADILWQNQNGSIAVWKSTGTGFVKNSYTHAAVGADWKVVGLADMNGDGTADILWRHPGGGVSVWLSYGTGIAQGYLGSLAPSWHVAGLGDFDGDGKADILWQNDNGAVSLWHGTGTGFDRDAYQTQLPSGWHIAEVGDFNGDGLSDVLLRSDAGYLSVWQARPGGSVAQDVYTGSFDPSWSVAGHIFV